MDLESPSGMVIMITFALWGFLKAKVNSINFLDICHHKQRITVYYVPFYPNMLNEIPQKNMLNRLKKLKLKN
jgi:hypothetical protein